MMRSSSPAEKISRIILKTAVKDHANPKALSNWIIGDLFRVLKERKLDEQLYMANWPLAASNLAQMVQMIDQGKISGKIAKTVFEAMLDSNKVAPANRQRKRPGASFRSGQHRGSYRSGARGQSETNRAISIRQRKSLRLFCRANHESDTGKGQPAESQRDPA